MDQNGSISDPPSGGSGGRSRYDQFSGSHNPEPHHHRQQHRSADLMDQDRPPPSSDYSSSLSRVENFNHKELVQVLYCYSEFQLAYYQTITKLMCLKHVP